MNLPQPPDHWNIEQLTEERTAAIGAFGFSPRQARFLLEVLIHSGVFVERQYCQFAGITHGQKTTDFLHRLVERGYARPIATGAAHRGRLFHVHHKPLYAAIDQADNRHRKRMPMGRMIERLMVLDAVVADRTVTWLGTEFDKRSYFMRRLRDPKVKLEEYPRLTFGTGPTAKHRYFPDKLPIGIDREDHVFVYLVTSATPMEFRLFLLLMRSCCVTCTDGRFGSSCLPPLPARFDCSDTRPGRRWRRHCRCRTPRCFRQCSAKDSSAVTRPRTRPIRSCNHSGMRTPHLDSGRYSVCGNSAAIPPFGRRSPVGSATCFRVVRGASNS